MTNSVHVRGLKWGLNLPDGAADYSMFNLGEIAFPRPGGMPSLTQKSRKTNIKHYTANPPPPTPPKDQVRALPGSRMVTN